MNLPKLPPNYKLEYKEDGLYFVLVLSRNGTEIRERRYVSADTVLNEKVFEPILGGLIQDAINHNHELSKMELARQILRQILVD